MSDIIQVKIIPKDKDLLKESSTMTSTQKKYIHFIQSLSPEELKSIKAMFCYDTWTNKQINALHRALKGDLYKSENNPK